MKAGLIKKIGISLGLAGALYFASPSSAYGQDEMQTPITGELELISLQNKEKLFLDEFGNENKNEKKSSVQKKYGFSDYDYLFTKKLAKAEIGYKDISELLNVAKNIDWDSSKNQQFEPDSEIEKISKEIEEKIIKRYIEISEKKETKTEVSNDELIVYLMNKQELNETKKNKSNQALELFEKRKKEILNEAKHYEEYISIADAWKNKPYVTDKTYWAISAKEYDNFSRTGYWDSYELFHKKGTEIIPLRKEFPVKYHIPSMPLWLRFVLSSSVLPVARNLLLTKYSLGKKTPEMGRYAGSFFAGLANGALGSVLIDGLNPWVFPARIIATPIIMKPVLKKIKFWSKWVNFWDNF